MVKVSITLPNNAQITFESEEPEVIHEVVGMVLRDLPRELMQTAVPANGNGEHPSSPGSGNGAAAPRPESPAPASMHQNDGEAQGQSPVEGPPPPSAQESSHEQSPPPEPRGRPADITQAERDFVEFCRDANPLGDMRRVVVAAEGAARYLGARRVGPEELGRLFDLAGWPHPHSFVQTLRNAARSKFRWLERVPGRSGQYTVTDLGRATAFGG